MVIKRFRDLKIWYLKCLIKKLCMIERHASSWKYPYFPQRRRWHRKTPGACFKCDKAGHWVKNCLSPQQLPQCCPDYGQAGHWRIDCPPLPRQGRQVPPGSSSTGKSRGSSGPGSWRLLLLWDLCPKQPWRNLG